MGSWIAVHFPGDPSCFPPSDMYPHLVNGEAGNLFLRKMMKRYSVASPLGTWLSFRSPCLSSPWMMWAAPLLAALLGSRENSQTERPLRRSTTSPHHTMCPVPSESPLASMGLCSAPLQCLGRWRSFCSSQQHQEQGGAS